MSSALVHSAAMDYEIERRASFEKKSGILQLSPTHLVWTADSAADGRDLRIAFKAVKQYQVSKAGGKKVRRLQHFSHFSFPSHMSPRGHFVVEAIGEVLTT